MRTSDWLGFVTRRGFCTLCLIIHVENQIILHDVVFCVHEKAMMKKTFLFSNLFSLTLVFLSRSASLPLSLPLIFVTLFLTFTPSLSLSPPLPLPLPASLSLFLPILSFLSVPLSHSLPLSHSPFLYPPFLYVVVESGAYTYSMLHNHSLLHALKCC